MSRFRPDAAQIGQFQFSLWQGEVPADFVLRAWLYVEGRPGEVLLQWEGHEPAWPRATE